MSYTSSEECEAQQRVPFDLMVNTMLFFWDNLWNVRVLKIYCKIEPFLSIIGPYDSKHYNLVPKFSKVSYRAFKLWRLRNASSCGTEARILSLFSLVNLLECATSEVPFSS